MRKRNERLRVSRRKLLGFYLIVLLIGVGMGVAAVAWAGEQQCAVAKSALEQAIGNEIDCKQVFQTAAWDYMKPLIWIWLSGFFPCFMPVSGFAVWYKGVFFGYGVGMLVKVFGGRGLLLVSATLLPQYLLFLPMLILFAYLCAEMFCGRTIYKEGLLHYVLLFMIGLVACWFCAWTDGYIVARMMGRIRF